MIRPGAEVDHAWLRSFVRFGFFYGHARDFRELDSELAGERRRHVQHEKYRSLQIFGQASDYAHDGSWAAGGRGNYDQREFRAVAGTELCGAVCIVRRGR